jgi:hypothetical protein
MVSSFVLMVYFGIQLNLDKPIEFHKEDENICIHAQALHAMIRLENAEKAVGQYFPAVLLRG